MIPPRYHPFPILSDQTSTVVNKGGSFYLVYMGGPQRFCDFKPVVHHIRHDDLRGPHRLPHTDFQSLSIFITLNIRRVVYKVCNGSTARRKGNALFSCTLYPKKITVGGNMMIFVICIRNRLLQRLRNLLITNLNMNYN